MGWCIGLILSKKPEKSGTFILNYKKEKEKRKKKKKKRKMKNRKLKSIS